MIACLEWLLTLIYNVKDFGFLYVGFKEFKRIEYANQEKSLNVNVSLGAW